MSFYGMNWIASKLSSSAIYDSCLSGESIWVNRMKVLGPASLPLRHNNWVTWFSARLSVYFRGLPSLIRESLYLFSVVNSASSRMTSDTLSLHCISIWIVQMSSFAITLTLRGIVVLTSLFDVSIIRSSLFPTCLHKYVVPSSKLLIYKNTDSDLR